MDSKLAKLFISNVRQLLGDRTAYWLAKESGVSQAALSRIFAGDMKPSLDTIGALADALGVTPASLLSSDEPTRVEKKVKVKLQDDQLFAIRQAINEMLRGEKDHAAHVASQVIPHDILEALINEDHDWNLIRAALDIPEVQEAKSKKKKRTHGHG